MKTISITKNLKGRLISSLNELKKLANRNAGDGQKLEGKASKALQDCLRGKREAEQKGN